MYARISRSSELSSFLFCSFFFSFFTRFHPPKPSTVGVPPSPPRAGKIHRRCQVDASRKRTLSNPKPKQAVNAVGKVSRLPCHDVWEDVESDAILLPAGNPRPDWHAHDLPVHPESDGASDGGIGGDEPAKGCEGEVREGDILKEKDKETIQKLLTWEDIDPYLSASTNMRKGVQQLSNFTEVLTSIFTWTKIAWTVAKILNFEKSHQSSLKPVHASLCIKKQTMYLFVASHYTPVNIQVLRFRIIFGEN